MKIVQQALARTGIPAFPMAWRSTAQYPIPPDTYMVYTTRTYESEHWDDQPRKYTVLIYLNLWTKGDPNEHIPSIRAAMRAAGFSMSEEAVSCEDTTDMTLVAWTWEIQTETEVEADGH